MNSIPYNARYAKLGGEVWKVDFNISNLIWRGVTNLGLLRSCAYLFSDSMSQEKIVGKTLVYLFFIAVYQSNILALYV